LRGRHTASITALPTLRQSSPQDLCENDGVVVLGVTSGVDECECAIPRAAAELGQPRTLAAKLLDVAATKLCKAARLVAEPLP